MMLIALLDVSGSETAPPLLEGPSTLQQIQLGAATLLIIVYILYCLFSSQERTQSEFIVNCFLLVMAGFAAVAGAALMVGAFIPEVLESIKAELPMYFLSAGIVALGLSAFSVRTVFKNG